MDTLLARHRDVSYDLGATLDRFRETRYVERTGPIGRLFVRGVATRTNQLMPFLAWYRSSGMEQDLSEAVDVFLNLY
jgi:hypothetical protein